MKNNNNDIWKKRGDLIRSARTVRGLLQKDVADALGVKSNTIAGYESGERKPDIDAIVKLCLLLDIDLALFCGINRNFKFVKVVSEN